MTVAAKLHSAIGAVCPIEGVSIGSLADKSTWRIVFAANATAQQKTAAQGVIANFDAAASQVSEDSRATTLSGDADRRDILDRLSNATLAEIDAFVDNNVTNIASAKTMFKKILRALVR